MEEALMIGDEHARLEVREVFEQAAVPTRCPPSNGETPLGAEVGEVSVHPPYCTRIFHKFLRLRRARRALTMRLRELAASRVGYRCLTVLLGRKEWKVNAKRIYRVDTEDGFSVVTRNGPLWSRPTGNCPRQ